MRRRSSSPSAPSGRRPATRSRRSSTLERSGFARFAASTVHQPTLIDDTTLTLRVVRDGRVGMVSTNRVGRGRAARGGRAAPRRRPTWPSPIPVFPGLAPAAASPEVEGWDEETAALTPEGLAERAWTAIGAAPEIGLYGYVTSGVTELAVASTTGLAASQTLTDATVLALAGDAEASGYADATAWRIGDLDPAAVARRGGRDGGAHARRPSSSSPERIAPCSAPGPSPSSCRTSTSARSARSRSLEGRSYLSGRIGEQVFDERLTIRDDATRPGRDAEGVRLRGRSEAAGHARRGGRRPGRRLGPAHRRAGRPRVDRARASGPGPDARAGRVQPLRRPRGRARSTSWPSWSATAST